MLKSNQAIIILTISIYAIVSCTGVKADGPRSLFNGLFGNKVKADPNADYPFDETNGPWMIYVKGYDGPTAPDDARTLALELRQKHGLKAYVYYKQFDHSAGLEEEEEYKKREMDTRMAVAQTGFEDMPVNIPKPVRKVTKLYNGNISSEYAVLVGDFQLIDDKDINKAFEKIKTLEPECLVAQLKRDIALAEQTGFNELNRTTKIDLQRWEMREQSNSTVRPLAKAMKCTNPILPLDYFNNRVDHFVQELNKDSRWSLLRNPGKYTIKVAEFKGFVIADPKGMEEALKNENKLHQNGQLARAGEKAENVCHFLREKGYEAYTFHDRTRSIVTVGGFDTLGKTDRNGNVVDYHPEVVAIFKTFAWDPKVDKTAVRFAADEPYQAAKSILNIPLLQTPDVMEVPRPFANYNRR